MQYPIVSVLMTTYNPNLDYLKSALDSIYTQSYDSFEIVLVDDGSEIDLKSAIQAQKCEKLKYIRLEKNQGITKALNVGLTYCQGKYIARMDDDDISATDRLEKQVKYLEEHDNVNILGCNKRNFGVNENQSDIRINNLSREQQQVEFFFSNIGVPHPSVMIRKKFLEENHIQYNEAYRKSQDYGLWVECSKYTQLCCLSDVLLFYRCHKKQISSMSSEEQLSYKNQIRFDQLKQLGIDATEEEKQLHLDFCADKIKKEKQKEMINWIRKLYAHNRNKCYFDSDIFEYRLFVKGYSNLKECNFWEKMIKMLCIFKIKFIKQYIQK